MTNPAPAESRVSHTPGFPGLLEGLGRALAVTCYQAGKLVLVWGEGGVLRTHFMGLAKPTGLAASGGLLAVAGVASVREYRDDGTGHHRASWLYPTGDVAAHELAYASGELWLVNTIQSCLGVLDADLGFVPRWRPPFAPPGSPQDCCHLNGLGVRDGAVRYATAHGESDAASGWRANKADGGVLLDVAAGEVIARGLSMPHSPRWHGGRLWVCNSGDGTLGTVDEAAGRYEAVTALPGFTRGLDFAGPYAFVGTALVRETALFSGIPVAELPEAERQCGVWAVNAATGGVAEFLRFDTGVEEVFGVCVLPVRRPSLGELGSRRFVR